MAACKKSGKIRSSQTMNTKTVYFLLVLLCIPSVLISQETNKKKSKEEKKLEQQKQTDELVNSKTFVFTGSMAHPQGGRTVNLTTRPNFVKFSPDLIDSDMPFFGRAYSGAGYGGSSDGGLTFKGVPSEFTVEKTKKGYDIRVKVKTENENYTISLAVGSSGNASLTISSAGRSPMSYSGDVSKPDSE
jgi:hypothetical protein